MSNVTVQEALKAALVAIDLYDYTMTVEESEKFAKAERLCKAALSEIEKCEPVAIIESLWSIIDDIDTYSDVAKQDDKLYRAMVERRQKDRWGTGIECDGYNIKIPEMMPLNPSFIVNVWHDKNGNYCRNQEFLNIPKSDGVYKYYTLKKG